MIGCANQAPQIAFSDTCFFSIFVTLNTLSEEGN